jgi:hypothetical protein
VLSVSNFHMSRQRLLSFRLGLHVGCSARQGHA